MTSDKDEIEGNCNTRSRWAIWVACILLFAGCSTSRPLTGARPFNFQTDTFAYPNELVWEYHFDDAGRWVHQRRKPDPDYTHHCFVVARSARQFFENARFDPAQPHADEATYRRLIRSVISIDPRRDLDDSQKVVIPGYANLHEFSRGQERLLKEECGGAWHSYFQRGHWRMVFPFSRTNQEHSAELLISDLKQNRPPIVHIVRFPQLTINHALLLFDVKETDKEIVFSAYDPNRPESPKALTFDRSRRTFFFSGNDYFPGGRVDVYEVYRSLVK